MIRFFNKLQEYYPSCHINEEKKYASFQFGSAFHYELRIQKEVVRMLCVNWPKKASFGEGFKVIRDEKIEGKKVNGKYKILYEAGVRNPELFTLRIEIPYSQEELSSDELIDEVITNCDKFHERMMPLINAFQEEPVKKLPELMGQVKSSGTSKEKKNTRDTSREVEKPVKNKKTKKTGNENKPNEHKDIKSSLTEAEAFAEFQKADEDLDDVLNNVGMTQDDLAVLATSKSDNKDDEVNDSGSSADVEYLFNNPVELITAIQSIGIYYRALDQSPEYRKLYEQEIRKFTLDSLVPRISNDIVRISHQKGAPVDGLVVPAMLKAEESYNEVYASHQEFITGLDRFTEAMIPLTDEKLRLAIIAFFINLGNNLDEKSSPSGKLTYQDGYFPVFLGLLLWPDMDAPGLDEIFFKSAGKQQHLSVEEKAALVIYDFILVIENDGPHMKPRDIAAAQNALKVLTGVEDAASLVGGFENNFAFEVFKFFNIWERYDKFHEMCLDIWQTLKEEIGDKKTETLLLIFENGFISETMRSTPYINALRAKDPTRKRSAKKSGNKIKESGHSKTPKEKPAKQASAISNDRIEEDTIIEETVVNYVRIGNQVWSTENLAVDRFRNGDVLLEVKSFKEWAEACKNKIPAYCYYDFDETNNEKLGKLYNSYAISDDRNLSPRGWRIPIADDFFELFLFTDAWKNAKVLKKIGAWGTTDDDKTYTGFNAIPGGFLNDEHFFEVDEYCFLISSDYEKKEFKIFGMTAGDNLTTQMSMASSPNSGYSVRCTKSAYSDIEIVDSDEIEGVCKFIAHGKNLPFLKYVKDELSANGLPLLAYPNFFLNNILVGRKDENISFSDALIISFLVVDFEGFIAAYPGIKMFFRWVEVIDVKYEEIGPGSQIKIIKLDVNNKPLKFIIKHNHSHSLKIVHYLYHYIYKINEKGNCLQDELPNDYNNEMFTEKIIQYEINPHLFLNKSQFVDEIKKIQL